MVPFERIEEGGAMMGRGAGLTTRRYVFLPDSGGFFPSLAAIVKEYSPGLQNSPRSSADLLPLLLMETAGAGKPLGGVTVIFQEV
jgi:hypothetical protein